jgi:hypothetical protein
MPQYKNRYIFMIPFSIVWKSKMRSRDLRFAKVSFDARPPKQCASCS